MLVTEVRSFQLSTIVTKNSVFDVWNGLSSENYFCLTKKAI